jgi:hypothetical protein
MGMIPVCGTHRYSIRARSTNFLAAPSGVSSSWRSGPNTKMGGGDRNGELAKRYCCAYCKLGGGMSQKLLPRCCDLVFEFYHRRTDKLPRWSRREPRESGGLCVQAPGVRVTSSGTRHRPQCRQGTAATSGRTAGHSGLQLAAYGYLPLRVDAMDLKNRLACRDR